MSLVARSISLPPDTTTGICASRKGVLISPIEVTIDTSGLASLLNRPNGTAISEDVRVLASGVGAASATITIVQVSGDNYSSVGGFSISTDDLVSAAGSDGSGVFKLRYTYNSIDYDSDPIAWSVVTAASPDTLAPTPPLINTVTAPTPTTATVNILVPSDVKSPASDADGLVSIAVKRALGAGSYSTVETINAGPGLSLQFVGTNIGSFSPAPTITQTGADWELTTAGLRVWSTSDECAYAGADISGDFIATGKFIEFTGESGFYNKHGIMCRSSNDVNAQWVGVFSMAPGDTVNDDLWLGRRATIGGAAAEVGSHITGISGDRYLRLDRVGDNFTAYYWQVGDAGWTQIGSTTNVAMGASVKIGYMGASQHAGVEQTFNVEDFSVQNIADVTHNSTGLTGNSTYNYKASATDGTNTSADGPVRSVVTPVAPPTGEGYEDILNNRQGFADVYGVTGGQGRALVTVTNLNDSGSGSLRQAQADNPNGAWIKFQSGLSGTINCTSGPLIISASNVTIDGRGANVNIQRTAAQSRSIDIQGDNVVFLYMKLSGSSATNQDNIRIFNTSTGHWFYQCDLNGSEDEVVDWWVSGSNAITEGFTTFSWCNFQNALSGTNYCLINGTVITNQSQAKTKVTFEHCQIDGDLTSARNPMLRWALVHMYNNYVHSWTNGDSRAVQVTNGGQFYGDFNYVDGQFNSMKRWAENQASPDGTGYVELPNNTLVGGATIGGQTPANVFEPTSYYSYTPDAANTALRDSIIANAGWQNIAFPS